MSKKGLEVFLEKARGDFRLADEFAKAVADIARREGYDVTDSDVIAQFLDTPAAAKDPNKGRMTTMAMGEEGSPHVRPLPPQDGPQATTLAMGEEDKQGRASVTLAIGEEDQPAPRPVPPQDGPQVTTMAMGEEDRHGRASVTLAIGEEDAPRQRPLPEDDLDVVTTAAVGEEGRAIKGPQSSAMGEEGNIPAPKSPEDTTPAPDAPSVTLAMGEEERKQPPKFTITTNTTGEEDKAPKPPAAEHGRATTMAMGEETRKPPAPKR